MKSDFLNDVMNYPYLTVKSRVGNNVMCNMESEGKEMHFLATDDSDCWGILMVQYQGRIANHDVLSNVRYLLRSLKPVSLPSLLHFECHAVTHEVRLVLRWPLYEDYYGYDDVKQIISIFFDHWMTIEPFIQRVIEGEDVDGVIAVANKELEQLNPQLTKPGTT
jgi:hypothetical protein